MSEPEGTGTTTTDTSSDASIEIPQGVIYAAYGLAGAIGLIAISMLILVVMMGILVKRVKPVSENNRITSR